MIPPSSEIMNVNRNHLNAILDAAEQNKVIQICSCGVWLDILNFNPNDFFFSILSDPNQIRVKPDKIKIKVDINVYMHIHNKAIVPIVSGVNDDAAKFVRNSKDYKFLFSINREIEE